MRIYVLVEGRRTESKIYPAWFRHILPQLIRIPRYDNVDQNSYFLISANGYPSIIFDLLPAAIRDINKARNYDYLLICLDADEVTVEERLEEINQVLVTERLHLIGAEMRIIIQNRCIETWLLGNRAVVNRHPNDPFLKELIAHCDITTEDPEGMEKHPAFATHSQFHHQYLKAVFRERGLTYTKINPSHAMDRAYLDRLRERIMAEPTQLDSLRTFFEFCDEITARGQ